MAGLRATLLCILVAPLAAEPVAASPDDAAAGAALAVDDECAAHADGGDCGLQALQLKARTQAERSSADAESPAAQGPAAQASQLQALQLEARAQAERSSAEEGSAEPAPMSCVALEPSSRPPSWCATIKSFATDFDSMDAARMQKAVDTYGKFRKYTEGITIALTDNDYYRMYHGNVKRVLRQYMNSGYFGWGFENTFTEVAPHLTNGTVHVVRDGFFTLNLGWVSNMFWNSVVKTLPHGGKFPYTTVQKLYDCDHCPAKTVFTLEKEESGQWKITDILLVKLAK